jgi:hypothetical protein
MDLADAAFVDMLSAKRAKAWRAASSLERTRLLASWKLAETFWELRWRACQAEERARQENAAVETTVGERFLDPGSGKPWRAVGSGWQWDATEILWLHFGGDAWAWEEDQATLE